MAKKRNSPITRSLPKELMETCSKSSAKVASNAANCLGVNRFEFSANGKTLIETKVQTQRASFPKVLFQPGRIDRYLYIGPGFRQSFLNLIGIRLIGRRNIWRVHDIEQVKLQEEWEPRRS